MATRKIPVLMRRTPSQSLAVIFSRKKNPEPTRMKARVRASKGKSWLSWLEGRRPSQRKKLAAMMAMPAVRTRMARDRERSQRSPMDCLKQS